MMPKMAFGFKNEPVSDEGILEDAYDFKLRTSLGVEDIESITNADDVGLEDSEMAKFYSSVRSFSADSGFNSDSEDVDENVSSTNYDFDCDDQIPKKDKCDCVDEENEKNKKDNLDCDEEVNRKNEEVSKNIKNSQSCLKESDRFSCSEKAAFVTSHHGIRELSSKLNLQSQHGSILLSRRQRNIDLDEINNRYNISSRSLFASRRQSLESANTSVIPVTSANLRTARKKRHGVQDLNNNHTGSRSLNSYLMKAPFKLQDCFPKQGLLGLAVCIIYTLTLMIVIGFLSMIMNSLKSSIGVQNLKTVRTNIIHRRRERMSTATG